MDIQPFIARMRRLHNKQGIVLRFAENGMTGLMRLHALLKQDTRVRIDDKDKLIMAAVLMSRSWGNDLNRTYIVYGLSEVEPAWLYHIGRDVEFADFPNHAAKGITSGRQKTREEGVRVNTAMVATSAFMKELAEWDITIQSSLEFVEELPVLVFRLQHGGTTITSVAIDGYSGRLVVNGHFTDELYTSSEKIQRILRNRLEELLDKLTAPTAA